jgi:hypothetical protein
VVLLLRKGGVIVQPTHTQKPIKFKGYLIPEYFVADFYFAENDGINPKNDASRFPTWSVQVLFRATKTETIDIVKMEILGSKHYKNYPIATTKSFNPEEYSTLKSNHLNEIHLNRVHFISVAVRALLQSCQYKGDKKKRHTWTILDNIEIPEQELNRIIKEVIKSSYTKIDGTFLQIFADRYNQLRADGDSTPIKSIRALYYSDKSESVVQGYATECRKKKLIRKTTQGKNSTPLNRLNKSKSKVSAKKAGKNKRKEGLHDGENFR